MKQYVPNAIKELSSIELSKLLKIAGGSVGKFADKCLVSSSQQLVARKPVGNSLDMYNWGFLSGLIEAHTLYSKLEEYILAETENRKEGKKVKA